MKIKLVIAISSLLAVGSANAANVYQNAGTDAWETDGNEQAMDLAFGAGNWALNSGYTMTAFTGNGLLYLDGGANNDIALNNFLSSNMAQIQQYVFDGGHLFINSAGWNTDVNMGFGGVVATLEPSYTFASSVATVNAAGVAAGLTNGGITSNYTAYYFSHDIITGGTGLTSFIDGSAGAILAGMNYGTGFVMFGGQTDPTFHLPDFEAITLRANELKYVAAPSAVPVPGAVWLFASGLLGLGALRKKAQA